MSRVDLEHSIFEIGGEDLLPRSEANDSASSDQNDVDNRAQTEVLDEIRVRIGTLLKTETVSLLLGAGASVDCGGQLIGSIPIGVERDLLTEGITGRGSPRVGRWLKVFYLAARTTHGDDGIPWRREEILDRRERLQQLNAAGTEDNYAAQYLSTQLPVNFERVLATLYRWRGALPPSGGRLRIDGSPKVEARSEDLDAALLHATSCLARACNLPATGKKPALATYKTLVRKLLTRPLNLKRVNIFTLNYDTLIEQAADAEGVVLLDGFVGTRHRVFRPESYEQDLYFPAETTEGRVHRFDRVLHLYKLHGSITWKASEPCMDDPYGVEWTPFNPGVSQPLLIYPTPAKFGEALGLPYTELFRRFASALARPQSVLFTIGYGFGDEHVNAIIRQALAVPSFTLVIVDPVPESQFVQTLRSEQDRRVWVSGGSALGDLKGFVEHVLPDLRDEEVRKKVIATYRALAPGAPSKGDTSSGN